MTTKEKIKNYIQEKTGRVAVVSMIPMGGVYISIPDHHYDQIQKYWGLMATLPEDIHDILGGEGLDEVSAEMKYLASDDEDDPYFLFSIIIQTI